MESEKTVNGEVKFLVSEEMKKVRIVQLDLLDTFSRICETNNLCYFLDGGTLLGAVRHKGFIPWDDDIDVIMPRKDYDKLCEIAEQVFQWPYFFQTSMTEEGLFRMHAQLRNSQTTGFIPQDKNKNINKGIFIDIFVLDGIADSAIARAMHQLQYEIGKKILSCAPERTRAELGSTKYAVYRMVHGVFQCVPFKQQFAYFEHNVLAKHSYHKTKLIGDFGLGWRKNVWWPAEWFDDYVKLPFEGRYYRAPIKYHEVLTKQYGNYMEIPKDIYAANGRMHEKIVFAPEMSYTKYHEKGESKV